MANPPTSATHQPYQPTYCETVVKSKWFGIALLVTGIALVAISIVVANGVFNLSAKRSLYLFSLLLAGGGICIAGSILQLIFTSSKCQKKTPPEPSPSAPPSKKFTDAQMAQLRERTAHPPVALLGLTHHSEAVENSLKQQIEKNYLSKPEFQEDPIVYLEKQPPIPIVQYLLPIVRAIQAGH